MFKESFNNLKSTRMLVLLALFIALVILTVTTMFVARQF